jgi:DNA-binding transcriptional MerR regulator
MKVGELAGRTGLSVRTLHYYEEIGLLRPSGHTESGHRLYTDADVARLQQIVSLRQLGFSLREIQACLDDAGFAPQQVIQMHLAHLREQIDRQRKLCGRLEALAACIDRSAPASVEDLIKAIEEITMLEKYYTQEQLEEIRERGKQLGEERIRQAEAEWQDLIAKVRAEMECGTDPASPAVQQLAAHWRDLVNQFTGGNPEIEKSLARMYQQEEKVGGMEIGPMRDMMEYVGKALAARK